MDAPSSQAYIVRRWATVFVGLALFSMPAFARAASLFISPGAKSVAVGQTFSLDVRVSSVDEAMNAASGDIAFPSDKLQVLSLSKANSIVNLWIRDPSFTNSQATGNVHFEGIALNPGFTGGSGDLITIVFEAIAAGDAPISFTSGAVLANDGNGTNILNVMQSGDVTIAPRSATVTPPPLPAGSAPAVARALGALTITELPGQDPTDPQPIFTWSTGGAVTRGITYTVRIDGGDWFDASTILVPGTNDHYRLPLQAPTPAAVLTVTAHDPAGNATSSAYTFSVAPIASPVIEDFTRTIPSSHQLFSVEGTAPTGTKVMVYLQKSDSILTYIAETDDVGHWSVANQEHMAPGIWDLHAQAVDGRGALSAPTPTYHVQASIWLNDVFSQIVGWTAAALAIVFLVSGTVFLSLNMLHQIRKWRVSSNHEMIELEERLRSDLDRIEKELDQKKPQ